MGRLGGLEMRRWGDLRFGFSEDFARLSLIVVVVSCGFF